ncbi:MAG: chromosome partitioning protein ParB, partial [Flavobacteriaceae bacterium]
MFDLKDYAGTIITDLFDEECYFRDPDTFWEYQNKAIATAVKELREKGWSEVIIMDRGESFHAWQYSKRPLEAGGKVFVETSHNGEVEAHLGYLTNDDAKKIDAILSGDKDNGGKPKTSRPEMSGPLNSYIGLHRHAAARAALLDNPNIALRLTVAHMLAGS